MQQIKISLHLLNYGLKVLTWVPWSWQCLRDSRWWTQRSTSSEWKCSRNVWGQAADGVELYCIAEDQVWMLIEVSTWWQQCAAYYLATKFKWKKHKMSVGVQNIFDFQSSFLLNIEVTELPIPSCQLIFGQDNRPSWKSGNWWPARNIHRSMGVRCHATPSSPKP